MQPVGPVVVSVELEVSSAEAYAAFTERFADWWPVATHSLSRCAATRCRFEPRVGGGVEEQAPDGTRHAWGVVQLVEPGRRLRFSWHPGREPDSAQWVEVEFTPSPGGSRVTLTHGGWETLGEIGPLLRQEYGPGWLSVLRQSFAPFLRARD